MQSPNPGEPSERTRRNIAAARCHGVRIGRYHIEWRYWTGTFVLLPIRCVTRTEFFNEGPVEWARYYWLTIGVSIYNRIEED